MKGTKYNIFLGVTCVMDNVQQQLSTTIKLYEYTKQNPRLPTIRVMTRSRM